MKYSKNKVEQYHYEEIVHILLILTSDLSKYNEDDLVAFSESIEGRIDILFTKEFLSTLDKTFGFTDEIINQLIIFKKKVTDLYESQWHNKFKTFKENYSDIRLLASEILKALEIEYIDPKRFSDEHLKINW
jgi:hypothetical protein